MCGWSRNAECVLSLSVILGLIWKDLWKRERQGSRIANQNLSSGFSQSFCLSNRRVSPGRWRFLNLSFVTCGFGPCSLGLVRQRPKEQGNDSWVILAYLWENPSHTTLAVCLTSLRRDQEKHHAASRQRLCSNQSFVYFSLPNKNNRNHGWYDVLPQEEQGEGGY